MFDGQLECHKLSFHRTSDIDTFAGLFAGGHLCAMGMGTLRNQVVSKETGGTKHHNLENTFTNTKQKLCFILLRKKEIDCSGVCWNFFEGNTWWTSVSCHTQTKHECMWKKTTNISQPVENACGTHTLPDDGKVVPPCFRLSYVTKFTYLINSAPPLPPKKKHHFWGASYLGGTEKSDFLGCISRCQGWSHHHLRGKGLMVFGHLEASRWDPLYEL